MYLGRVATVLANRRSNSSIFFRRIIAARTRSAVIDLRFTVSGIAFLHYSLTAEVQSSCLQLIVNGRFGVVPELECRLGSFEPGDIIRLNFQMRRQIVKELHLVAHIQVLDCLADFLNRAHGRNLVEIFPDDQPS
jgi:hypothetical protein